jgi:hypothetical protein
VGGSLFSADSRPSTSIPESPGIRTSRADDGTLYLLFEEKPFSVKDRVANLADVPAVVRGTVSVRNGVKGIQMKSIEKADKTEKKS